MTVLSEAVTRALSSSASQPRKRVLVDCAYALHWLERAARIQEEFVDDLVPMEGLVLHAVVGTLRAIVDSMSQGCNR